VPVPVPVPMPRGELNHEDGALAVPAVHTVVSSV